MIKETGKVVKVQDSILWVETTVTSTCSTCSAKANCGTSSIAKAFTDKSVINQVENSLNAKIGDVVEIGIPESSLVSGSFYLYLLPLIVAISFAIMTQFWLSHFIPITEPHIIVMTFVGGAIGFYLSKKRLAQTPEDDYQPQLLDVLASNNEQLSSRIIEIQKINDN